jgi:nucleotide-binding universal stress UspA family protein
VPIDGSEYSQKALKIAASIASKYGSEIKILHIVPTNDFEFQDASEITVDIVAELNKYGNDILNEAKKSPELENIVFSTQLLKGNPAKEICNVAKNDNMDLIVLASRGLGKIAKFIHGSVSTKVLQLAECPVLSVRQKY